MINDDYGDDDDDDNDDDNDGGGGDDTVTLADNTTITTELRENLGEAIPSWSVVQQALADHLLVG
jgi:hypothetical protein